MAALLFFDSHVLFDPFNTKLRLIVAYYWKQACYPLESATEKLGMDFKTLTQKILFLAQTFLPINFL